MKEWMLLIIIITEFFKKSVDEAITNVLKELTSTQHNLLYNFLALRLLGINNINNVYFDFNNIIRFASYNENFRLWTTFI